MVALQLLRFVVVVEYDPPLALVAEVTMTMNP